MIPASLTVKHVSVHRVAHLVSTLPHFDADGNAPPIQEEDSRVASLWDFSLGHALGWRGQQHPFKGAAGLLQDGTPRADNRRAGTRSIQTDDHMDHLSLQGEIRSEFLLQLIGIRVISD